MRHYSNSNLKNSQQHGNMNAWATKSTPNPSISLSGYLLFGKHEGKKVSDVPKSYLQWVAKTFKLSSNEEQILREFI